MTSQHTLPRSTIPALYGEKTRGSAALHERACRLAPSGLHHDSRQLLPHPLFIARASGSRKWDVDGNEYVDYAGGHGALLLGHDPLEIRRAVRAQIEKGTHYGGCSELELRWAELVTELVPSIEKVRFVSSGTEATHLALRLARAFTGMSRVVRFKGHFHGWQDHTAFGYASHFDGSPTPGVLRSVAESVVLVEPGNLDLIGELFSGSHDVAAVLVEPTGASWGQVPMPRDFLSGLRDITSAAGVVLVFDEVISGFRCARGGAQEALSIRPDLTTLGKIVAGGLPGAAVGGRAEILDLLSFEASARRGSEKIPHQGTFNANPLSAAAGVAMLEVIRDTDVCERAIRYAAALRCELQGVFTRLGVSWLSYGSFSGFHVLTGDAGLLCEDLDAGRVRAESIKGAVDRELVRLLRLGLLAQGVDLMPWPGGITSAVHGEEDLEQTVRAFESTVTLLRDEGVLDRRGGEPS